MHAGCRCFMKERRSVNAKPKILIMLSGDLTSTSSKNTHFLQGMCKISSRLESSTGRCRLSTGRCRLSTGNANFLQEVLYFYRKLPVEVRDGPEFILWGDLTTKFRHGGMQATISSITHWCHLLLPPQLTCNKSTCTIKADHWVIKRKQFLNEKRRWDAMPYPSQLSKSPMSVIVRPLSSWCSMHPRRKKLLQDILQESRSS